MIYNTALGLVLEDHKVVAMFADQGIPVGCTVDADKEYYMRFRNRTEKILAKGDEALLLFLVSRFSLKTLEKAEIWEQRTDVRPVRFFQGEGWDRGEELSKTR